MTARVLVAGVGNIFLGDDGFGVEVASALSRRPMPAGVAVGDFGIRGVHLAYQLLEGYDVLILVDAVRRGEEPGTLSVIEPETERLAGSAETPVAVDAHGMDPASVLRILDSLGGSIGGVLVVGCEVEDVEEGIGLSEAVSRSVPAAADLVMRLVAQVVASEVGAGAGAAALSRAGFSRRKEAL